jgi:hypothetical protein
LTENNLYSRLDNGDNDNDNENADTDADDDTHLHVLPPERGVSFRIDITTTTKLTTSSSGQCWLRGGIPVPRQRGCLRVNIGSGTEVTPGISLKAVQRTSLVLQGVKTLAALRNLGDVLMHDIDRRVNLRLDVGDL